jgi:CheY-like chemotaxis protein
MNAKKKIFLLEDHPETREIYAEILISEGFEVIEQEDAVEALDYFTTQQIRPDLLIMDLTFPGMSAFEFKEKLNQISTMNELPLVVISGQTDIAEQAREMKANAFLRKPFDMDDLITTVKQLT